MTKDDKVLSDSATAAASPFGIYSPKSIDYFVASDRRNRLHRQLAFREMTSTYKLRGKLLDLGAGCGGSALVWRELGFDVLATDIQEFFVDYMTRRGLKARKVDATDISATLGGETFDVAYGCGLTPQVRRVKEQALRTYQSVHRALNPGGYFIFEFSIARTPEYRETYYDPTSLIQIIAEQGLFELIDTEPVKSIPARLYTQWN